MLGQRYIDGLNSESDNNKYIVLVPLCMSYVLCPGTTMCYVLVQLCVVGNRTPNIQASKPAGKPTQANLLSILYTCNHWLARYKCCGYVCIFSLSGYVCIVSLSGYVSALVAICVLSALVAMCVLWSALVFPAYNERLCVQLSAIVAN